MNSRRLKREKTISMQGAKPKKFSAAKAVYTNTYVVAVCLEDEGQYPALMFTHDPAFDSDGPRAAEVNKLVAVLGAVGETEKCVVLGWFTSLRWSRARNKGEGQPKPRCGGRAE